MLKIEDKKELMKLCSFIVMGDGGVYSRNEKWNCQFIMNMKAANKDYIEFCRDVIENITTCRMTERKDYNTDGFHREPQYRLESNAHPYFTAIRERVYTGKYKGLDPHAFKLFDWQCMAILFMSDGSSCIKNGNVVITLNMKRLSYGDQLYLKEQIREKLGVEFNINRNGKYFYLTLRFKDRQKFYDGIKPYMFESFSYKILDVKPSKKKEVVK